MNWTATKISMNWGFTNFKKILNWTKCNQTTWKKRSWNSIRFLINKKIPSYNFKTHWMIKLMSLKELSNLKKLHASKVLMKCSANWKEFKKNWWKNNNYTENFIKKTKNLKLLLWNFNTIRKFFFRTMNRWNQITMMLKSTKKNTTCFSENINSLCKKRNNSKNNLIKPLLPRTLIFRKWTCSILIRLSTTKRWTEKLMKEQKITQIKSFNFKAKWISSKVKPKK